jgi:hypothetical protein
VTSVVGAQQFEEVLIHRGIHHRADTGLRSTPTPARPAALRAGPTSPPDRRGRARPAWDTRVPPYAAILARTIFPCLGMSDNVSCLMMGMGSVVSACRAESRGHAGRIPFAIQHFASDIPMK